MTDETTVASFSDIRDNARAITQMIAFKVWKANVEGQIEARKAAAVNPMKSQEEVLERNYQNGETAGMMNAVMHWDLLIEQMEQEIQRAIKEQGEDNAEDLS
jgi:hypothetical protein